VPLHLEPAPPFLFRVGRLPNPFTWRPPWSPLLEAELGHIVRDGSRWDSPDGAWNTLYLADSALVAFAETIAWARPRQGLAQRILEETDEEPPDPEHDFPLVDGGHLPRSFFEPSPPERNQRALGTCRLELAPLFIDVSHPDTHHELNLSLAGDLARLGIDRIDRGIAMQQDRGVTRPIAAHLYNDHRAEAIGIRYESRFVPDGWCYAAWENATTFLIPDDVEPVTRNHPDLREAAALLHIELE